MVSEHVRRRTYMLVCMYIKTLFKHEQIRTLVAYGRSVHPSGWRTVYSLALSSTLKEFGLPDLKRKQSEIFQINSLQVISFTFKTAKARL